MKTIKYVTRAVIQGDFAVSENPDVVLSTVLGSCVAVCLHDPVARVGGMNHYLLPKSSTSQGCGVNMMELLINGLLKKGAQKSRLQAKLFGGARMTHKFRDIGAENVEFSRTFLRLEGIPCLSESLRGNQARNVKYWPESGRARLKVISADESIRFERKVQATPVPPAPNLSNDLELF